MPDALPPKGFDGQRIPRDLHRLVIELKPEIEFVALRSEPNVYRLVRRNAPKP